MGPHQSSATSTDFNPKQWHQVDHQTSQSQLKGNYKVLQNIHTGELIDQYQLVWPSQQDFRFYLDSYLWRRQQYNIVASRFIVQHRSQKFCSRSYSGNVYIEHIPTRLSDVTDIPYPDNLYVGLAIMDGYQKLYQNVHHYFPVAEDQICVDRQGIVKVWVNSDLSKNYPEPQNELSDNKDQSNMVDQLLNLLWQNTDEESEPVSFRSVSCQIPQRFNSILQMIDESDEYQHTNNQIDEENNNNGVDKHDQQYHQNYDEEAAQEYQQNFNQQHQQGIYQVGHHDGQYPHEYSNEGVYPVKNVQSNVYPVQHQKVIYEPVVYNQGMIQSVSPSLPAPLVVNPQFIPRQVTPSNGHIITIPPIPGRYNVYTLPTQNLPNPSTYKASYKIQQQQPQQIQNFVNQSQQQQIVRLQQLSNKNQGFQKHVSMLNPPEGQDYQNQQSRREENRQQRQNTNILGQFSNRKEININYPVGRSLQLPNQSHQESLRTNKSQNDPQLQQTYQVPFNKIVYNQEDYYEGQRYNGVNQNQRAFNIDGFRYQNNGQNSLQTKYYTIDTEIDLDQQIAADLRKMIRAG